MSRSHCSSLSPHDEFWNEVNPDVDALDPIVSRHFGADCLDRKLLGDGAYGRAFLYTLSTGRQVVAKVILSVQPIIKTEREAASMLLVKEKTSVPVPDVYLFCSTVDNPVRAEWIVMESLQGERFIDCFEDLSYEKRYRTAADLARFISPLFNITSSYSGSIFPGDWCKSLRYPAASNAKEGASPRRVLSGGTMDSVSGLCIGPIHDSAFLQYPNQVPPESCGRFTSDMEWMEAVAYFGIPGTRSTDIKTRYPYDKIVELFYVARQFERKSYSLLGTEIFHFSHGDLHDAKILIDPETGAVTGLIDWEMAGFRPPWLAAVASEWFNDDRRHILIEGGCNLSECTWRLEGFDDQRLRAFFRMELWKNNELLYHHNVLGVEYRGFLREIMAKEEENTAGVWERRKPPG
ncbi:hypothetical protein M422DRAFT_248739 [Sphaerobolus stellatus SS14]|nr:hypothetical protein M422DRAFT_248739 [Sphaerobolus stellatus SS14]